MAVGLIYTCPFASQDGVGLTYGRRPPNDSMRARSARCASGSFFGSDPIPEGSGLGDRASRNLSFCQVSSSSAFYVDACIMRRARNPFFPLANIPPVSYFLRPRLIALAGAFPISASHGSGLYLARDYVDAIPLRFNVPRSSAASTGFRESSA